MFDNILFFQPRNNYSGSCRVLLTEIEDKYANCDYKVITTGKDGFLNKLDSHKIVYVNYPKIGGKTIHGLSFLIYSINLFFTALYYGVKYRVFYINTIIPFQAAVAGMILRKPIIYHVHEKFVTKNAIKEFAERIFNKISAKHIYVSHYLKESYCDDCKTSEVNYNRLSKSFCKNIKFTPVEERSLKNIIMLTARASREKGVDVFFKTARVCPEFDFYLITEEKEEKVKLFINDTIPANLHICYGGGNISSFLERADLLVNLSNPQLFIETFGMTILEGMAYGLPVLAPNAGGPVELVKNGFNGYLIDNINDITEIKGKIKLILNPTNYTTFSNNSIVAYKTINDYGEPVNKDNS